MSAVRMWRGVTPFTANDQTRQADHMQAFALSERYLQTRAVTDDPASLVQQILNHKKTRPNRQDQRDAKTAWAYFEHSMDHNTGLGQSNQNTDSTSLWDIGGTFLSIVAAHRLGVISKTHAVDHLIICLESLGRLPLRPEGLPSGCYSVKTLRPLDLKTQSQGNYASHTLRLVSGFIVTAQHYPSLAAEISIILNRWNLEELLGETTLSGLSRDQQSYASRAAYLINLPVKSSRAEPDTTSDQMAFEAMEFGWQSQTANQACIIYLANKSRFEATGNLIAQGNDNTAYLSSMAGFYWPALLPTPFNQKLRDAVDDLATPMGWQNGIDVQSGKVVENLTLNTNAAVLEALHYKALGPLFGTG